MPKALCICEPKVLVHVQYRARAAKGIFPSGWSHQVTRDKLLENGQTLGLLLTMLSTLMTKILIEYPCLLNNYLWYWYLEQNYNPEKREGGTNMPFW